MNREAIAYLLRPTKASIGYALFLALNAAGVWGGVFPFLPKDFQTGEILLAFFTAQSLVFSGAFFASAAGSYFFPGATRAFLVKLASVPYFFGWCALVAAIYLDAAALALVVAGGALLGLGSAGFYMLWQRLFASRDAQHGTHDLMVGTLYSTVVYFALYLIPQAVTTFLIPLVFLPLFGLCIVLETRTIDTDQAMFQDVPRDNPRTYRHVMHGYWRSALCVGALGFCAGVARSLAIGPAEAGELVNALSMIATFVVAVIVIALWVGRDLRINMLGAYRVVFPFAITSFFVLPVLPSPYGEWLAAILYALYTAAIILMMVQCAQASRDHGINPVFIYGFIGGIVYALNSAGFILGALAERSHLAGIPPLAAVSLLSIYLLGLMNFVGPGGFRTALSSSRDAASIELMSPRSSSAPDAADASAKDGLSALAEPEEQPRAADVKATPGASDQAPVPATREVEPGPYRDRIAERTPLIKDRFRLSTREAEVMEYIARGYSVARIAEELVVSENTIRTHSKRIYAKLNVHKKQELMDLVNSFAPPNA